MKDYEPQPRIRGGGSCPFNIPGRHSRRGQFCNVMPAVTWVPLATQVPSSATDVTGYRDNTTVTAKRFYRIKIEP